jgi:hypothetical protein
MLVMMLRRLVPEVVYTVKRLDVLPTTCAMVGELRRVGWPGEQGQRPCDVLGIQTIFPIPIMFVDNASSTGTGSRILRAKYIR